MTSAQFAGLISAILGITGTGILYISSYSLQSLEGGVFGSDALTEYNNRIKEKNARRLQWQRVGILLLFFSFIVQACAVFL